MVKPHLPFDPIDLAGQLRNALAGHELAEFSAANGAPVSAAARRAACEWAAALGDCRLFGAHLENDLDNQLPSAVAMAAARELESIVRQNLQDLKTLPERLDQCEQPLEIESLCRDVFETARSHWAAFIAIDEAWQTVLETTGQIDAAWRGAIDRCLDVLDEFDQQLAAHADLLTPAVDTRLLENWRRMLVPPWQNAMPWWLDGAIEQLARRNEELAASALPVRRRRASAEKPVRLEASSENAWNWLSASAAALAAAAPAASRPPAPTEIRWWRGPAGACWACAVDVPGANQVRINFLVDQRPARELQGKPVELAGVWAVIDGEGNADFARTQLQAARRKELPPRLMVEGEVWTGPLLEPSPEEAPNTQLPA